MENNWNEVKKALQQALQDGEIPLDGRKMGAKAVYEKFQCHDAFANLQFDDTFKDQLVDLRKQERAAQSDPTTRTAAPNQKKKPTKPKEAPPIDWAKTTAKQLLKKLFSEGIIPVDYTDPKLIWTSHCEGTPEFTGMVYDANFRNRLNAVKDDYSLRKRSAVADQKAYDNFRRNHPRATHNARGEPLWDGSQAQLLLKEDMQAGLHSNYKQPKEFWQSRPEFQVYPLAIFRDHMYQETRLWKLHNLLKAKADKQQTVRDKKQQAQMDHLMYVREQEELNNNKNNIQDTTTS